MFGFRAEEPQDQMVITLLPSPLQFAFFLTGNNHRSVHTPFAENYL
jgi:hypothetical protein